jgi:hypothetical protein
MYLAAHTNRGGRFGHDTQVSLKRLEKGPFFVVKTSVVNLVFFHSLKINFSRKYWYSTDDENAFLVFILGPFGLVLANRVTLGSIGELLNTFNVSHTPPNEFMAVLVRLSRWEWHGYLLFFCLVFRMENNSINSPLIRAHRAFILAFMQ